MHSAEIDDPQDQPAPGNGLHDETLSMDGEPVGAASDAAAVEPPSRWGHLQVLGPIGKGGFGEVFRAHDPQLQRDVALKLLRTDSALDEDQFLREGQRLAQFRHPNVLAVHGAARHDGRVGLWTDLLRGDDLEDYLERHGLLRAEEAALIAVELCRALAAIHSAGLVHRDIKASNIMREAGGRIVLMDFGCVSPSVDAGLEGSAGIHGTPLYMAPEQLEGHEPEARQDLHAVGVLMYRLVTGGYPVSASTFEELTAKKIAGTRTPLRDARADLPSGFVMIVERLLATKPEGRFQSAGALESAMQGFLGAPGSAAAPAPQPLATEPAAPQRVGHLRAPWYALAAIVVVAVVAVLALQPREFALDFAVYRAGPDSDERLRPMSRVRKGDNVFMEVKPTESVYLYVINEDEIGNTEVLFPRSDLATRNPLRGGELHRVPGLTTGGDDLAWTVTSVGEVEHFLIVASREPMPEIEADLARVDAPNLSVASRGKLRGLGGTSVIQRQERRTQATLASILESIPEGAVHSRDGTLVRQFELANPKE